MANSDLYRRRPIANIKKIKSHRVCKSIRPIMIYYSIGFVTKLDYHDLLLHHPQQLSSPLNIINHYNIQSGVLLDQRRSETLRPRVRKADGRLLICARG